ncbi:MAG: tRNA uridine-5-carboxymethylaminomethyl(34) synthesis GTPase MnmE [Bacillota bacterium]
MVLVYNETIAAIATAPGEAGIGIVRISGDKAVDILDSIFKAKSKIYVKDIPSRKVTFGYIFDDNRIVDEVLAIVMKAPYSYTTEDVVEIHCHGGIVPIRKIMELVLHNGAVLAEPGEFTKRAFLNGRIDLTQAEAVIDVITSKTENGLNAAVNQLEGSLSDEIKRIMDNLLAAIAHIEASIDFPEHDIEEVTSESIKELLKKSEKSVRELIDSFEEGRIVKDGLSTAIIGRPNVGKSSLLNVLLKYNRAIVTDIPGTTRDIIEEYLNIGGVLIKLIDTAGIRETEDIVEKIGVERTKEAIKEAELIIFVIDMSEELLDEDKEILSYIKDKKVVVAANKIDAGRKADIDFIYERFGKNNVIEMSVKNSMGIQELEKHIKEMVYHGNVSVRNNRMVTNIRHKDLLDKAIESIKKAIASIDAGVPVDLVSVDIKDSWSKLGSITGDTVDEDIVTEIFSKFCIGK